MKPRSIFNLIAFCISSTLWAQEWNLKGAIPARAGRTGFATSSKGYMFGGSSGMVAYNDLQEYDPVTNGWTSKQSAPLSMNWGRERAMGFTRPINGGVVGFCGGFQGGLYFNETWTWSQNAGWQQGPNYPGASPGPSCSFSLGSSVFVGGPGSAFYELQAAWVARAPLPTSSAAQSFSIAGKGYLYAPTTGQNFWMYDPNLDTWSPRASFPGTPRTGSSSFVIGNIGHMVSGVGVAKECWAYDAVADQWIQEASLWGNVAAGGGFAFAIGTKGYFSSGADLWEFGPAVNTASAWVLRYFSPGPARSNPIAFTIGSTAFAGGGEGLTDLYAYDPTTRGWTTKANLPGPVGEAFAVGGKGYVVTTAATQNFWMYDPVTNAWSPRADLPGGARSNGVGLSIEGKGYVGTGNINGVRQNDFWEYDPLANSWLQRSAFPTPVYGALGFSVGNLGYVGTGNYSGSMSAISQIYQFNPVTNTWSSKTQFPTGQANGAIQFGMAWTVGNKVYAGGGYTSSAWRGEYYEWDPVTNVWTPMPDMSPG